jgi:hypothetical protein
MNRQQRRAAGLPREENKRVQVYVENAVVVVKLIGTTSHVENHALLSPKLAVRMGWAMMKGAWKAWRQQRRANKGN